MAGRSLKKKKWRKFDESPKRFKQATRSFLWGFTTSHKHGNIIHKTKKKTMIMLKLWSDCTETLALVRPFVFFTRFFRRWNARGNGEKCKDNQENIGIGWKSACRCTLHSAPLQTILFRFAFLLFDVWCLSTSECFSMSLHSLFQVFFSSVHKRKQFSQLCA